MRFSSRYGVIKNTKKRIINLTAAAVLAVTGMSGALPLFLSQKALAAPGVVTTASGFDTLTDWQNDRSEPSGGFMLDNDQLSLDVDGDHPAPNASEPYYRTEGRTAQLPAGTNSIKATLFVDSAWENTIGVRAGIWGVTAAPSVYPIIEFSNRNDANDQVAGDPVIRAWDSNTGWTNLINDPVYGMFYTFEIVHDPADDTFKFYVNDSDTPLRTVATTYDGASHGPLDRIIFNSYNSGIPGNDYSVNWTGFEVGERNAATIESTNYGSLAAAVAAASDGDTIELNEDVTLHATLIDLDKTGLTLNGNGHTITTTYAKGANGISNAALQISADGVTVNDLTVESTNSSPAHGINVFEADDVSLNNIVVNNNAAGVIVNNSVVTIDGITSTGNKWGYAINVDKGSPVLNIMGTNSYTESKFIFADNDAIATVNDIDGQYQKVLGDDGSATYIVKALPSGSTVTVPSEATTPVTVTVPENGTGKLQFTTNTTDPSTTTVVTPVDITVTSPKATVVIPAGTTISGPSGLWTGAVTVPTFLPNSSVTIPSATGTTTTVVAVIEIGAGDTPLTFDKGVRILMVGQGTKKAGFLRGGTFTPIDNVCTADSQSAGNALGEGKDCYIKVIDDLVIWTKHFTSFVAYAATTATQAGNNNGGSTTTTSSRKARSTSSSVTSAAENAASVLGIASGTSSDATKTPATTNKSTDKDKDTSSNFLGLGWWWLLVLAAVAALGYLAVVRHADR